MDLEPYGLRIFCQVMLDKTFSQTAKSLGITQPTVSQQIAKLENRLQGRLFERVRHDLVPTELAFELLELATRMLEDLDDFECKLLERRSIPRGLVRYAMPESCQWTPHYRRIMSQICEYPEIRFEIDIKPCVEIMEGLLSGAYDFGFVVGERLSPEIRFEKFGDEHYSAVAADKRFFAPLSVGEASAFRLISYPGWEQFFMTWSKAHGLAGAKFKKNIPQPVVRIGTLAGAIHAAQEGAGVAVIPTHCVAQELKSGLLYAYEGKKGSLPIQTIHVARKLGRALPRRAELVLEMLKKAKLELA